MRTVLCIGLIGWTFLSVGQVHLDRSLRFTASDSLQRGFDTLGHAAQEDALMSYGPARTGSVHWAIASGSASSIQLQLQPPASAYEDGMLIRFVPNHPHAGYVNVNVDGLGPVPLIGSEKQTVAFGEMDTLSIAEIQFFNGTFKVRTTPIRGCPSGTVQVNERFCMQQGRSGMVTFASAARYCADRGAKLCSWDEYIHGCTTQNAFMQDMFTEWEWINDTSDHTHTADQVGRFTCRSQRSRGAADGSVARARCCYHLP
ncbi:MAG: hypothetical protein KDB88_10130 [Flavobacteriales bacterium]|nr:hypothetical protein [Flavobacteriales bacterium]